jgi:hypothetical protein
LRFAIVISCDVRVVFCSWWSRGLSSSQHLFLNFFDTSQNWLGAPHIAGS